MRGRKKLKGDEDTVRIAFRLPESLDEFIRTKAIRCGMRMSDFIRFVLSCAMKGEIDEIEEKDITKSKTEVYRIRN